MPMGGSPRKSVFRITDRPDMISAIYLGHKALNQKKKFKCNFLARLYKVQVELLYSLWRPR